MLQVSLFKKQAYRTIILYIQTDPLKAEDAKKKVFLKQGRNSRHAAHGFGKALQQLMAILQPADPGKPAAAGQKKQMYQQPEIQGRKFCPDAEQCGNAKGAFE